MNDINGEPQPTKTTNNKHPTGAIGYAVEPPMEQQNLQLDDPWLKVDGHRSTTALMYCVFLLTCIYVFFG